MCSVVEDDAVCCYVADVALDEVDVGLGKGFEISWTLRRRNALVNWTDVDCVGFAISLLVSIFYIQVGSLVGFSAKPLALLEAFPPYSS